MSIRSAWLRISAGLLAGAVTAVAPFFYYWRLEWQPLETTAAPYITLLLAPVVVGGMVAVLVASERPRWWLGAVLGFVLGVVAAGCFFSVAGDVPKEWWLQLVLSLCCGALAGVAGGVGGGLAWGFARTPARRLAEDATRRVKPWQVGMAVCLLAVVVFGALAVAADV